MAIQDIKTTTARVCGITVAQLCTANRVRQYSWPRFIAFSMYREFTTYSLPKIGKLFNSMDHTSVLHGLRRAESLRKDDPAFASMYDDVRSAIVGDNEDVPPATWSYIGSALHSLTIGICEAASVPNFPINFFLVFRDGLHALSQGLRALLPAFEDELREPYKRYCNAVIAAHPPRISIRPSSPTSSGRDRAPTGGVLPPRPSAESCRSVEISGGLT